MPSKQWYRSKTIWTGITALLVVIIYQYLRSKGIDVSEFSFAKDACLSVLSLMVVAFRVNATTIISLPPPAPPSDPGSSLIKTILVSFIALLLSGCVSNQNTPLTPEQAAERGLTNANDAVALAYNTIADARDARLVTQEQIDPFLPLKRKIDANLDVASDLIRKANFGDANLTIAGIRKSLVDLEPLLKQISSKKWR